MMPDNKKPRSGQQRGKDGYLLGANNGRCSQVKYTTAPHNNKLFDVDEHLRGARQGTPEPRVAVYRIAASVPFVSHAALRRTGRYF